jgi:autotransporter-associated beta strand protein
VTQTNNRAFRMINASTGQALEVYNSNNTAGATMSAGTWNTSQVNNQRFWLTPVGIYNIRNQYGSMVARVANSSTLTQLDTITWSGANYQKWRFIPTYDGYTKIINVGSGLVADLKNGSSADNTYIQQYSDLNNDAQKWAIERLSDDSSRILNKVNGKAWEVTGSTSGSNVNQVRWLHTLDQQWTFELQAAMPGTRSWTGGGASGNWSDTSNWDIPSYAPDALQFGTTLGAASTNNFTADYQVSGIKFLTGAGPFTLNGNRIGLLGDVVNQSASLQTINLPIELLNTKTFYVAAESSQLAIAGAITGTGSLAKNGAYTLTLSGTNSYSGQTQILAGTLKMGADNVLPSTTALTISAGAALDLNGTDQTVNTLSNLGSITNTSCSRAVLTVTSPAQSIILPGNNMEDLDAIAGQWLQNGCVNPDWCSGADRNHDTLVDLTDFELLSSTWLYCN